VVVKTSQNPVKRCRLSISGKDKQIDGSQLYGATLAMVGGQQIQG